MDSNFEDQIGQILRGEAIPTFDTDVERIGLKQFIPVTKSTIGYIVRGVFFDASDRVLMIQEAKSSCYGKWYLPTGRLESGENLLEGAKREVKEEAGLEFEPTTLTSIDFPGTSWMQFNFTGNITGGNLKTEAEKDNESLQANWFKCSELRSMTIRHNDIFPIIEDGIQYHKTPYADRHPCCLPAIQSHSRMIHRQLITYKDKNKHINILTHRKNGIHLPSVYLAREDTTLFVTEQLILTDAFGKSVDSDISHNLGLLSLEHCGKPSREHDGVCFTTLVLLTAKSTPPAITNDNYEWRVLSNDDLTRELENRLQDGKCIPINYLRG